MKKTNLLKLVLYKEGLHWHRVFEIYGKYNGFVSKMIAGTIVSLLFTLGHYCHVIAHVLYELVLFVFANKLFKSNLQRLALTCNMK